MSHVSLRTNGRWSAGALLGDLRTTLPALLEILEALAGDREGTVLTLAYEELYARLAHSEIRGIPAARAVDYAVRKRALRPFPEVARGAQRFEVNWAVLRHLSVQIAQESSDTTPH